MAKEQKRINKKKTILLVDDDGYFRFALATELRAQDYLVISAEDGERALKMLQDSGEPALIIDLVITDLVMPRKDGLSLCNEIRKLGRPVSVLVITGFMSDESEEMLREVGCTHHLEKPFTPDQLIKKIEEILEENSKT